MLLFGGSNASMAAGSVIDLRYDDSAGKWIQEFPGNVSTGGITALTHDVTASGSGSVAAEVTGITDSSSVDWQVTGPFANGKALGFVSGGLQAVSFQAPLTACTDYVSLTCVTGATDLGGTNATPTVTGIETGAVARGDINFTPIAAPGTPSSGHALEYVDSTSKNLALINDTGTVVHGIQSVAPGAGFAINVIHDDGSVGASAVQAPIAGNTCGSNTFATSISTAGALTCTQPAFSNLNGSAACSQLPALTGDTHTSAGSCGTVTDHLSFSSGSLPLGACSTDGEAVIRDATGAVSCKLPAGDLGNDYTAPSVIGIHDGAGVDWTTSGVVGFVAGQFVEAVGGNKITTNTVNFSGLSGSLACGQLPALTGGNVISGGGTCATYATGLLDGSSVNWTTTGQTWTAGQVMVATASGTHIGTDAYSSVSVAASKIHLCFSSTTLLLGTFNAAQACNDQSFLTPPLEWPIDFTATKVAVKWYLQLNSTNGTTQVLCQVTRNGTAISATGITISIGTTLGIYNTSASTGSSSANDTYGEECTVSGTGGPYSSGVVITSNVVLTP